MDKDKFFKSSPGLDKAYQTADGLIFVMRKTAEIHAKSLDNKKVEILKPKQ